MAIAQAIVISMHCIVYIVPHTSTNARAAGTSSVGRV